MKLTNQVHPLQLLLLPSLSQKFKRTKSHPSKHHLVLHQGINSWRGLWAPNKQLCSSILSPVFSQQMILTQIHMVAPSQRVACHIWTSLVSQMLQQWLNLQSRSKVELEFKCQEIDNHQALQCSNCSLSSNLSSKFHLHSPISQNFTSQKENHKIKIALRKQKNLLTRFSQKK